MKNKSTSTSSKGKFLLAGLLVAVIGLGVVIGFNIANDQRANELPGFTDSFEAIQIPDDQTPLSDQDVKTTKQTTKKTVKLKKKAAKTYVKRLPNTVKTSTAVKEGKSKGETVKIKTTVKTQTKEQYRKQKKTKTVIKTVTRTVVTTTYKAEPVVDKPSGATDSTDTAMTKSEVDIKTASKADDNVISAFEQLGFKLIIDGKYQYTGYFGARDRCIILRKNDDNVYHELGHFVAFAAGNIDTGSAFQSIFKEEKSKYDGRNASYVLSSASEYFAESYREYVLSKATLKSKRPKTCEAIGNAVSKITSGQVDRLKMVYASTWK